MRLFFHAQCLLLALLLSACREADDAMLHYEASPQEQQLAGLIRDRLLLAPDVAWSKFESGASVYAPAREAEQLATLGNQAGAHGLDASFVETFFEAQFQASRLWQNEWVEAWNRGVDSPEGNPPDLQADIRPQLDRISSEILQSLSPFVGGGRPGFHPWALDFLKSQDIPNDVAEAALQPFDFSPD